MKRTSQREKILNHLLKFKQITSWEAIQLYHITRISEYIRQLRGEGYLITTERQAEGYGIYRLEEV